MLTLLLSCVLGLAQAPALDEAARTLALLRRPESDLRFEGPGANERIRLVKPLLEAYAGALGWKLEFAQGLDAELAKTQTGLSLPGSIASDNVHALVQTIARVRGLCFRLEATAQGTSLAVERVASASSAGKRGITTARELLPAWSEHPAFVLTVEWPHAKEGSAELCARMRTLLDACAGRTDVRCSESGALEFTGSSADLGFVFDALSNGPAAARGLETTSFPPDPNTPEGRAAAVLPVSLRVDFPARDVPLSLYGGGEPPNELEVVQEFGRWDSRPLLFVSAATRPALEANPGGADLPTSVPAAWAHEFISGLLADSGCTLRPLPVVSPVVWAIERNPEQGAPRLDLAGVPTIALDELGSAAHLAATRFQCFVRLPRLSAEQRALISALDSPDERAPFWITELDEPGVYSVIGTPRAITSAVLALRLSLTPPKPR
ncbi:MAG: hypothetical protein IPJ19_16875 [Planctomycetes bacterium]|nr:hypothetical protein [Planctomycetota bacterium]